MRLRFAEAAAQDLKDIVNYIAQDSPTAAEKVYRYRCLGSARHGVSQGRAARSFVWDA